MSKFKPRYKKKAQTGIQSVNPDFSDVNAFLSQEASNANTEVVKGIGTTALNVVAPGVGSAIGAAATLGETVAGDQTNVAKNVVGDLINPFSGINAAIEGNVLEAIPIAGSVIQSKRIKKEQEKLQREAERRAAIQTDIATIGADVTQVQGMAKKGKRYKKGTKAIYQKGTGGVKGKKRLKRTRQFDAQTVTPTGGDLFGLTKKEIDKLQEFVPRIKELETTRAAILQNPNVGVLENLGDKAKALGENLLVGAGDAGLFGPITGQTANDLVSEGITNVMNFLGLESEANVGEFNIGASAIPPGFEDKPQEEQTLAILAENFSRAKEEFGEEAAFRIAASSFNKGFENAKQDELNDSLSFFGQIVTGTKQENKMGRKYKKGSKTIMEEGRGFSFSSRFPQSVEVEKDEMLFRKVNGRYMLVADFNGGLTHEEGGIDTTVLEGDVIFPGSKRKEILNMLDSNGFVSKVKEPMFETERLKLPADTDENNEAQEGLNFDVLGSIGAQLIPALTNVVEGTQQPEPVTRRFVRPQRMRFIDTSQQQLREAEEQVTADAEALTRTAGGSAGAVLANVGAASARRLRTRNRVLADRAQQAQQVENINVQMQNEADRLNTQLDLQFDLQEAQDQAQARNIRRQGLTQFADIGQQQIREKQLRERDEKMMRTEQVRLGILAQAFPNFTLSPDIIDFINTGEGDISELIQFRPQDNTNPASPTVPEFGNLNVNPVPLREITDVIPFLDLPIG